MNQTTPTQTSSSQKDGNLKSNQPGYSMAEVGMINRQSQIRGTATGIFSGLLGALVIRNVLKRTPNATVMGGLLIGSLTGYISSSFFVQEGMKILEEKKNTLNTLSSSSPLENEMSNLDLRSGQNQDFNAGVAGLHEFQDRSNTTRGDH